MSDSKDYPNFSKFKQTRGSYQKKEKSPDTLNLQREIYKDNFTVGAATFANFTNNRKVSQDLATEPNLNTCNS